MSLNIRGSLLVITAISSLISSPYGYGRDRAYSYTQSVLQNNLIAKRAQLHKQISQNLTAGRLYPAEAAALRDKLQRLADLQLTYSEDSALNEREANHLMNGFNQVSMDMNRYLNDSGAPGYRWNSKYNRFYRNSNARAMALRIDRAVADGIVGPREAEHMRAVYLSEGPRYTSRLNELNGLLNRLINTRTASSGFRHWD